MRRGFIFAFAATAVIGCGNSGSSAFTNSPPPGAQPPSDGGAGSSDAAVLGTPVDKDAAAAAFIAYESEASTTASKSVCAPGVYRGQFMTLVGSGPDGGAPGLFSIMWNGNLTIDLMSRTVTITSGGVGEGTGTSTTELSIAEGGALEGGDAYGGNFFANLDGDLDCAADAGPPYHLTATLSNGTYSSVFYNLAIGGHLEADYMPGTPPSLANGSIFVDSAPDAAISIPTSATGTWSATWTSP